MCLRLLFFSLLIVASFNSSYAQVGYWKSIDDKTGITKGVMQIYENSSGYLIGKVAKVLDVSRGENPLCEKCPGDQKNKPMLGLVIMSYLKKVGEGWYSDGKILDPETGNEYGCEIWLEGSDILKVRGKHWTGFYRTQTCYAISKP